mgnify:CR=1 FL=1
MAKIDAGKLAGFALLIGGIGWFAWKIPKGAADWKPFFTAGLGLIGATLGAVILFRKIPTAEVGWIDLTKEVGLDDEEDSVNLKVTAAAEHRGRELTPAARKYVSDKISEIVRDWKKTGRIGSSHPKTLEQAQKQAVAVAYSYAIKAGHKIPKGKIHYE